MGQVYKNDSEGWVDDQSPAYLQQQARDQAATQASQLFASGKPFKWSDVADLYKLPNGETPSSPLDPRLVEQGGIFNANYDPATGMVSGHGANGPFAAAHNSSGLSQFIDTLKGTMQSPVGGLALATLAGPMGAFGGAGAAIGEGAGLASGAPLAADASWGVNPHLANPFTSPEIGEVYDKAINVGGGGSAITPQPFNIKDFIDKASTGNKTVDQLLTKAATTALGSGNAASAGAGGDTTGATQQAADEARKRALIDQINAMYDPKNFETEEGGLATSIRGQQGDALKLAYGNAERETRFDAARRGNVGGSTFADNESNLSRDNQLGATRIEDAVNSTLAGLRSKRLSSQNDAISLVNSGSGPEAVNSAASGIRNAIDSARAATIPDATAGLFKNVAVSDAGINQGNNATALNGYIGARLSGGGTLFPSSGYKPRQIAA